MKPCCCLFCFTKRKKEKFFVQQHMTKQSNIHCLVRKFLLQILWWCWILINQIDLVTKWVYNADVERESLFSCVCFSFLFGQIERLPKRTYLTCTLAFRRWNGDAFNDLYHTGTTFMTVTVYWLYMIILSVLLFIKTRRMKYKLF